MEYEQLKAYFVTPVLKGLVAWSQEAEDLMIGTFAQESGCGRYVKQLTGTALGFWQMGPANHDDIWCNYLPNNTRLAYVLLNEVCKLAIKPTADLLLDNIRYACSMARIHYMRVREPIPTTIEEQATYWKRYYNTQKGKGTTDDYISNYAKYTNKKYIKQNTSKDK